MEAPSNEVLFNIQGQKLVINLIEARSILSQLLGRNLFLIGKPLTVFKDFPTESLVTTSAIQRDPEKFVCKLTDLINSLIAGLEVCKQRVGTYHLGFKAGNKALGDIELVINALKELSNSFFRFKSLNRTVAIFIDEDQLRIDILTGPEEQ